MGWRIEATYDLSDHRQEKRRALERWGAHIMALVSGKPVEDEVVRLRRVIARA